MPTVADIAVLLGVPPPADPRDAARPVRGVATLAEAAADELSFAATDAFRTQLESTRAAAVIVTRKVHVPGRLRGLALIVDDVDLSIAKVLRRFAPPVPRPAEGVDARAMVAPSAGLSTGVAVGPGAYIGERVRVGRNSVIHFGAFVGDDSVIGDDCQIFQNVVIRERVTIGDRVIIHAGSVLGSDGFGYRWDGNGHAKIPQIGTIIVEDDVEIGSCVCIDRAKFSATRVGRGSKIDNLVQVAHNVTIGPHCIITGQAGMAGSVTLGAGVMLGGQSAVRDHVSMGDGSMLAACSGVMDDVPSKQIVSGLPALPHRQNLREQAALRRLPDLVLQVRKLQERLNALEGNAPLPTAPRSPDKSRPPH